MTAREDAAFVINETMAIERMVQDIPYSTAKEIIRALETIRGIVGEAFPGGYFGKCAFCEEPKGEDEMETAGDEHVCEDCCDKWRATDGVNQTKARGESSP